MDNKILFFVVVLVRLSPTLSIILPAFFSEEKKKKPLMVTFFARSVAMETTPSTSMLVSFLSSASQIWSTWMQKNIDIHIKQLLLCYIILIVTVLFFLLCIVDFN